MGKMVNIDAAADQLGISKRSVRRLISSGELTAYRIGKMVATVRIDSDDLDKLLKPVVPNGTSLVPKPTAPKPRVRRRTRAR
jgi:excisionase family DNA binding protein